MERRFLFGDNLTEPEKIETEVVTDEKNLPVLADFSYDKRRSYRDGNPYVIVFCYCIDGKGFVVKGGLNQVDAFLKDYPKPLFLHRTIWNHGVSILTAGVSGQGWVPGFSIFIARRRANRASRGKRGWRFSVMDNRRLFIASSNERSSEFTRRRLPRCWMQEFNRFVVAGER